MKFVISAYGNAYLPFLTVCIHSLKTMHPHDDIHVLWDDLDDKEIAWLTQAYPGVTFHQQEQPIAHQHIHQRIPLKLRYWLDFLRHTENQVVCFLDSDMLIHKNISSYVQEEFDILYTWKNEKFPLNVGIVIVKNSENVRRFFELWLERIEQIISHKPSLLKACDTHGAADQQALADLMEVDTYEHDFVRAFDFGEITFKAVPCEELNQTNSVPIESGASIFHYKGGWHPIILQGEDFSPMRPKETSLEMRRFWENLYADANERLLKQVIIPAASKHVNILNWADIAYEERGILHSEMLAVLSMMKELDIDLIIESGRCRGQSTAMLAEAFQHDQIPIISIEWTKDANADFAEKRLAPYSNLTLLYGDSNRVIPNILQQYPEKRTAILFDGPKGKDAYDIFSRVIHQHPNVVAGFFHDCRKSYRKMINFSRDEISLYYDRIFFTDEAEYVKQFRSLDEKCQPQAGKITEDSWRPYMKGFDPIGSYGPTLAVVLPNERDRKRWEQLHPNALSVKLPLLVKQQIRPLKTLAKKALLAFTS